MSRSKQKPLRCIKCGASLYWGQYTLCDPCLFGYGTGVAPWAAYSLVIALFAILGVCAIVLYGGAR